MQMFDASSMIYAWDNYPLGQFPPLWAWLGSQVNAKLLTLSETAFKEVCDKSPECEDWLKENQLTPIKNDGLVLSEAASIKSLLQIEGDNYHVNGVDENDLLIIAASRVNAAQLVSNEAKQPNLPSDLRRYKIPAVCAHLNSPVPCQDFIDYIKASQAVFG
ncbi:MAG: DUF4411 family protein [Chloroflexi bacterium]|nr:DUF4411 family protein [Chloroflexota bacterium]